jgi:hypothetical protein
MENNNLITGILISLVFALLRYIESKFIKKKPIVLKQIFQEVLMIYLSYILGVFLYGQIVDPMNKLASSPSVFTTDPDF